MVETGLGQRGIECELVPFKTTADKKRVKPLSEIGAKGLFTHELEVALRKGKVDCCVHSLKDLPVDDSEDLEVVAVLEREDPRDVLVVNAVTQADSLASLPAGSRVGTSSPRRRAQLAAARGDLEIVELRGDVPTRLRKVDTGQVHAAILAAADLIMLDAKQRITEYFEPPHWLPAAGQGAIAIQMRREDDAMRAVLAPLDHTPTAIATRAERAFLAALDGGGQVPIGALAMVDAEGRLVLHGFVSDLEGRDFVRGAVSVDSSLPEESGRALAADLRTRGATSLLIELRNTP